MVRFLLISLVLSLSACGPVDDVIDGGTEASDSGITGEFRIEAVIDRLEVGSSTMEIFLYDENNAAVENAVVTVMPHMPAMGHGSNLDAVVTEMGDGKYEASPIGFTMPGAWEVKVMVEESAELDAFEHVFSYEVQ